jgi:hypothetical protein
MAAFSYGELLAPPFYFSMTGGGGGRGEVETVVLSPAAAFLYEMTGAVCLI